jgi:hypothetical protein
MEAMHGYSVAFVREARGLSREPPCCAVLCGGDSLHYCWVVVVQHMPPPRLSVCVSWAHGSGDDVPQRAEHSKRAEYTRQSASSTPLYL